MQHILKRKHAKLIYNPIRISINKIENKNTFRIKKGFYLVLLTPERMNLLGSTKRNITKMENVKMNLIYITEVVLVHCNIINYDDQQDS